LLAVSAMTILQCLGAPAQDAATAADLPTGTDLIDKCIEAMGGEEAFKSIKSSRVLAVAELPGMGELTVELLWAEGDKMLAKQSLPGMGEFAAGSDGTVVWGTDPMTGELAILTGDEAEQVKTQAGIATAPLRMKADLKTAETLEKADFRGIECFKVKTVTSKDEESIVYFDAATGLLAGSEEEQDNPMMGPMTVIVQFLDYKDVEPLKTYSRLVIDQGGMEVELTFKEIEFNNVDPARFDLPEKVKELVAAQAKDDDDDAGGGGEDDADDDEDGGDGGR